MLCGRDDCAYAKWLAHSDSYGVVSPKTSIVETNSYKKIIYPKKLAVFTYKLYIKFVFATESTILAVCTTDCGLVSTVCTVVTLTGYAIGGAITFIITNCLASIPIFLNKTCQKFPFSLTIQVGTLSQGSKNSCTCYIW